MFAPATPQFLPRNAPAITRVSHRNATEITQACPCTFPLTFLLILERSSRIAAISIRDGFWDRSMASETYFRAALGVIILLTTFVTGFHRFKAAQSGEKISRKDEGFLFALVLRLSGLVLFIVTIAYLIAPASVQWAMLPVLTWVRWIGVVTGLLSSLLMYWTLSSLGKNLTDTVVIRNNATLVTDGPYRWVRHPFYVTTALIMASVTLLTANWLIGLLCLVVLAMLAIRTPKEERALIKKFGQPYLDYMARTGRFVPRII